MTVLPDGTNRMAENLYQNNILAQSDYEKALDGLRDYFIQEGDFETRVVPDNENSQEENVIPTNLVKKELMKACHSSLEKNFKRMVQPVPDEIFHQIMDQYYPQDEYPTDINPSEIEKELLARLEGDQEEEPYEEDDLLDPKALTQALELREKVRQISQRVEKLRNDVLSRATQLGPSSSCLNEAMLTSDSRPNLSMGKSQSTSDQDISKDLYSAMANLTEVVNHPQLAEMSKKMELLQETLEVVQADTSQSKTLSQTESAIISRTNCRENEEDARHRDLLTPPSPGDVPPDERLASFLSRAFA